MLCARRLVQLVCRGLASYSLDALLARARISLPAGRHRALPDALVTAVLLQRLLTDGAVRNGWSRLSQLRQLAGLPRPAARPPKTSCSDQPCQRARRR
jgi:DNA polymerase III epsilon subunit-like protein